MNLYANYPQIWAPPHLPSLFVVRVPQAIASLDEKTYRELMVQRMDWMIQQWIAANQTLLDTQTLLATHLSQLHSFQQYPLLNQDEETFSLWAWRMEWAEAFILHNSQFSERLWWMGMNAIDFPVAPLSETDPQFPTLLDIHQTTHLEEWLGELTPSYWD